MHRSCVCVYVHFVWRTWDRLPLINPEWEPRLHACIAEAAREIGCEVLRVGGIEDHVHVLARLSATVTVAQVAKQMKGNSSHFVSQVLTSGEFFQWQGAYGAFSVDPSALDPVVAYIEGQRRHHGGNTTRPDWERCQETDPA